MNKILCERVVWTRGFTFKCGSISLYSWLRNYQLLNMNEIPWIRVGVELFTRPSPFSPCPYRKGLGTKLGSSWKAPPNVSPKGALFGVAIVFSARGGTFIHMSIPKLICSCTTGRIRPRTNALSNKQTHLPNTETKCGLHGCM